MVGSLMCKQYNRVLILALILIPFFFDVVFIGKNRLKIGFVLFQLFYSVFYLFILILILYS